MGKPKEKRPSKDVGIKLDKKNVVQEEEGLRVKDLIKAAKHVAGAAAVPDALILGALRPNSSVKKEWEQVTKDFPDSALNTSTYDDLLGDMGMPDNRLRNVLGFAGDVIGPSGAVGIGSKVLQKLGAKGLKTVVPNLGKEPLRQFGNWVKKKGAKDFIANNIKQKDFDRGLQHPLEKLVEKNEYYQLLSDPRKLREKISGGHALDEEKLADGLLGSKKLDGTLGEVGEKIGNTAKRAKEKRPDLKVNRDELFWRMLEKQGKVNKDRKTIENVDLGRLANELELKLKPSEVQRIKLKQSPIDAGPKKSSIPEDMPDIPTSDLEEKLSALKTQIDTSKKTRGTISLTEKPEPRAKIEDLLATKQDAENQLKNVKRSNAELSKVRRPKASDLPPAEIEVRVPHMSDIEELHALKVDINDQLKKAYKNKNAPDFSEKEDRLLRLKNEVDDSLADMMKKVELDEGNALDLSKQYNNEFSMQSKMDELLKPVERRGRQAPKESYALGRILGATAGAIPGAITGNPTTIIGGAVLGGTATEIGRKVLPALPAQMAKWGDRLSDPLTAHIGTHATTEGLMTPFRDEEEEVIDVDSKDVDFSMLKGRGPDSVVEIPGANQATDIMAAPKSEEEEEVPPSPGISAAPKDEIEEKMDRTLNPQRPLFDPYINDEILNTPLPRDSKRLMQNPNVLKAKVGQLAPDKLPLLEDMMTHDPETLRESGSKIAMMFPAIFEKDKYNAFDGKIIDPMMQEKFLKDLVHDESMDSISKAQMAMRMKLGQSIHGDEE